MTLYFNFVEVVAFPFQATHDECLYRSRSTVPCILKFSTASKL